MLSFVLELCNISRERKLLYWIWGHRMCYHSRAVTIGAKM